MSRPLFELADLVRSAGIVFFWRSRHWIRWTHIKVLLAIARCRTAALGGHIDRCTRCGHRAISYNSCRNRHCPRCQTAARERWIAARQRELLPTRSSWERMRNLCRVIVLRSVHSLLKNCRMLLPMETLRCSRSGAFGRRQRFFTRILPPVGETNPRPIYSRHYYDVAMLAQGQIRADALADRDLLAQVVRH